MRGHSIYIFRPYFNRRETLLSLALALDWLQRRCAQAERGHTCRYRADDCQQLDMPVLREGGQAEKPSDEVS